MTATLHRFARGRSEQPEEPPQTSSQALLADPVVRVLVYVSIGLTILFLATVVGVLATGVVAPTGPRSVAERELMIAAAQAEGASGRGVWRRTSRRSPPPETCRRPVSRSRRLAPV